MSVLCSKCGGDILTGPALCCGCRDALAARVEALHGALRELVACKDMKDRIDANFGKPVTPEIANLAADYECRKPAAWRFARAALAAPAPGVK
jgi:hypothetical protein